MEGVPTPCRYFEASLDSSPPPPPPPPSSQCHENAITDLSDWNKASHATSCSQDP